jgi:magnesium transporter
MKKRKSNYAKKAGLPPESLVYTGNRQASPASVTLFVYDGETCDQFQTDSITELKKRINISKVNLLVLNNLTDVTLIEKLGQYFVIQPMVLEDVLNTAHPPKAEESGDQLLLTLKIFNYGPDGELEPEHISFILGGYYILVLKDNDNNLFHELENRIMNGKSRARQKKADYLFYLLIDTLIDSYYHVINEINNKIDKLEEQLLQTPGLNYIQQVYQIKQSMTELRGVIYPVRESLLNIIQGDYPLLKHDTIRYLHDVKDHINHIIQMYESGRETLSNLIELNNANINNRLNSSMNLLTIITTLFIPLTLIAGIYGMNYKFMPELNWKMGYPFAGLLMLLTAGVMYLIMKRKKLL